MSPFDEDDEEETVFELPPHARGMTSMNKRCAQCGYQVTDCLCISKNRVIFTSLLALLAAMVFAFSGCSYNAPKRTALQNTQAERGRELTQAAKLANDSAAQHQHAAISVAETLTDTNTPSPAVLAAMRSDLSRANDALLLSGDFLRRDLNNVGLPVNDQSTTVKALLSENAQLRASAQKTQQSREAEETQWRAQERVYETKLLEMGAKFEEERNKSIVSRFWGWLTATFGIGGLIALCIFFPAAIPILARMVGWVVGKIPAAVSAIGVVGARAFDSVVTGVGNVREQLKANKGKSYTGEEVLAIMNNELKAATDADHRAVIEARRVALNYK